MTKSLSQGLLLPWQPQPLKTKAMNWLCRTGGRNWAHLGMPYSQQKGKEKGSKLKIMGTTFPKCTFVRKAFCLQIQEGCKKQENKSAQSWHSFDFQIHIMTSSKWMQGDHQQRQKPKATTSMWFSVSWQGNPACCLCQISIRGWGGARFVPPDHDFYCFNFSLFPWIQNLCYFKQLC